MEMRAIYAEALAELMEADRRVVLLDADLGKASGTLGLRQRFPEQIFDCGVAEQNMASIAAGLASYGFLDRELHALRHPAHLRPDRHLHRLRRAERQDRRHRPRHQRGAERRHPHEHGGRGRAALHPRHGDL